MQQGRFCFIAEEFYSIHDKDCRLMRNKETIDGVEHGRPCFFAFPDSKSKDIYWCVPISSKVAKYTEIYKRKIEKQIANGIPKPKCNTICFGEVMGIPRAFLVQNMFPITEKYIASLYIDRNTKTPVTVEPKIERLVTNNARDVLRLVNRGHRNLVFSDVIKTYKDLNSELGQHEQQLSSPSTPHFETKKKTLQERLEDGKEKASKQDSTRNEHSRNMPQSR